VASSGLVPTGPRLSCAEGSRAGHRTPGGFSPEEAESPPSTCCYSAGDAAQDTVGLLGCERTLVAHVKLFIDQYPKAFFAGLLSIPSSPSLYL